MTAYIVLLCSLVIIYHYAIYPAAMILLARLFPRPAATGFSQDSTAAWPSVAVIIAAYNEELVIDKKIQNSLALEYPLPVSIIVVSDGSTDNTACVVGRYCDRGVVSLHEAARNGKSAALNRAIAHTDAQIVVFSDANNDFNLQALIALVAAFADPSVGGVSGVKRIRDSVDRESSMGDSLYWRYESAIKQAEGTFDSITNADGEIFALRRELWKDIPAEIINDDAEVTFNLVSQGKRVLYEPGAVSTEYASISIEDDFFVKVRMVAGGIQTLRKHWRFLLPPRTWFSFSYLSHKALRYFMPVLLLVTFALTFVLAMQGARGFLAYFVLQTILAAAAIAGCLLIRRIRLPGVLYVPFYFFVMNAAALLGLLRAFRGTQGTSWRKARR